MIETTKTEVEPIKVCAVCNKNYSLYKCPRCFILTCSLECCLKHKQAGEGCNGKRDRTSFCRIRDFTDSKLRSDYHFLEDVLNITDSTKRLAKNIGAASIHRPAKRPRHGHDNDSSESYKLHNLPISPLLSLSMQDHNENNNLPKSPLQHNSCEYPQPTTGGLRKLIQRANERGIRLLIMPNGMERRKRNTTKYFDKTDLIKWKVEWIFHNCPGNVTTIQDQIFENSHLITELKKHVRSECKSNSKNRLPLKCPFRMIDPDQLCVLLKRTPCASNRPKFFSLDPSLTLRQALKEKTIIEYITLDVVLPQNVSSFPLMIKDISSEHNMKDEIQNNCANDVI